MKKTGFSWIALGLSIVALGASIFFLVDQRAATGVPQALEAAGNCVGTDGQILSTDRGPEACFNRPNAEYWESFDGETVIDNPNESSIPPGEDTLPLGEGNCFIDFPATDMYYPAEIETCLADPDSYAWCPGDLLNPLDGTCEGIRRP
jgi:hypothetical protein